jgi:hypothetical protein
MVGGREMWWVLASGGQLDGVVNSMGDYVISIFSESTRPSRYMKNQQWIPAHINAMKNQQSSACILRISSTLTQEEESYNNSLSSP